MENQKIMELFDNITNRPSKFRTRNWVEVMMNHEENTIAV